MSSGIVREIKRFGHIKVANEMYWLGYRWDKPHRRPTNIEVMLESVPRHHLEIILQRLKEWGS